MGKNTRLPERPKPPSWDGITEDVSCHSTTDDDVVFTFGKSSLSSQTNVFSSPERSRDTSDSETDISDIVHHTQEMESSYNDVLRLISFYSELKEAPAQLEQQYSHLKSLGENLTQSILNMKKLAQSVSKDVQDVKLSLQSNISSESPDISKNRTASSDGSISLKTKNKPKKKK